MGCIFEGKVTSVYITQLSKEQGAGDGGVSNQKQWGSVLGPLEKGASAKENRQVGGKMQILVVDMSFKLLTWHRPCPLQPVNGDFVATQS